MQTYVIRQGDTLWSIAGRLLGDPLRWHELWTQNRAALEAAQRGRMIGGLRCVGPDWIFPGTVIQVAA